MQRTPLLRKSGLSHTETAAKVFRPRRCKHCREKFVPERKGQVVHVECVEGWVKGLIAKKQAKDAAAKRAKARVEKAQDRKKLEAMKTIADLIADTQQACNAYIRYRDAGKPCFDCDKPFEPQKRGGSMDAGHLRSRGAAGHLRFDEHNIFGQRKNCNRPGGATEEAKKAGAAKRVGQEVVDALYADNRVHKWQRDELIAIKLDYRAKLKALKKDRQ